MKPAGLPRFGIPLLAALLLHGLWLSLSQLQSSRQTPQTKLSARDDTAELLVLSRRLPEEQEIETIPLPPRLSLPPPPPALFSAAGTATPKQRALRVAPPRRLPGATKARAPGVKSPLRTPAARPPDPDGAGALATLAEGAGGDATPETSPLLRPAGEAADSWRKLWEGARPASAPGKKLGDLPESVELRELPLSQARGAGVIPSHGQAVVLSDHLILLWIENGTLWMLRSPTTPG
jgi:hypothetical protein